MTLTVKACKYLCVLDRFKINGINANSKDFGETKDTAPELAEEWGCGNMCFIPKLPTQQVLDKYGITVDEYNEVCDRLTKELHFGCCGWCS